MTRKTKRDWLEAGMAVLATEGAEALTIDQLATRLGVTKGSFYHHFKGQADYRDALLAFWKQTGMAPVNEVPDTPDEAWEILDEAVGSSLIGTDRQDPGMAIRFWATRDASVHSFVERVDGDRLRHAERLFEVITGDRERARFYSHMLYALVLGSGHIVPPVDHRTLLDFYSEFKRLVRTRGGGKVGRKARPAAR